MKLFDSSTACVAHTRTQTAHKLINGVGEHSLVRNTSLNAFGNELVVACLEVSVCTALAHCAETAHSTVNLELSALIDFVLSGTFLTACNK